MTDKEEEQVPYETHTTNSVPLTLPDQLPSLDITNSANSLCRNKNNVQLLIIAHQKSIDTLNLNQTYHIDTKKNRSTSDSPNSIFFSTSSVNQRISSLQHPTSPFTPPSINTACISPSLKQKSYSHIELSSRSDMNSKINDTQTQQLQTINNSNMFTSPLSQTSIETPNIAKLTENEIVSIISNPSIEICMPMSLNENCLPIVLSDTPKDSYSKCLDPIVIDSKTNDIKSEFDLVYNETTIDLNDYTQSDTFDTFGNNMDIDVSSFGSIISVKTPAFLTESLLYSQLEENVISNKPNIMVNRHISFNSIPIYIPESKKFPQRSTSFTESTERSSPQNSSQSKLQLRCNDDSPKINENGFLNNSDTDINISIITNKRLTHDKVSKSNFVDDSTIMHDTFREKISLDPPINDTARQNIHSIDLDRASHESLHSSVSMQSQNSFHQKEVLVGTPVKEGHANYMLMYDMLTGIRISVSRLFIINVILLQRCNSKPARDLIEEDYTAAHKIAFDIRGDELTPTSNYDFKFKDYAPWVFRSVRSSFRIDFNDYLLSLTGKYVLSELGSPGKSGSFFYFSQDYRFIIKTIHHKEHLFLRKILKYYLIHVREYPSTLISRIFGLHRVKLPGNRKIHFVVMGNVFPPNNDIHEIYDLKGSTKGRFHPPTQPINQRTVLKDQDWLNNRRRINLGPKKKKIFYEQLLKDTEFLRQNQIMDYSLLIGIHDGSIGNQPETKNMLHMYEPPKRLLTLPRDSMKAIFMSGEGIVSSVGVGGIGDLEERRHVVFYKDFGGFGSSDSQDNDLDIIYYLGIIDIFTLFTARKRGESVLKRIFEGQGASCVDADAYAKRFIEFCKYSVESS